MPLGDLLKQWPALGALPQEVPYEFSDLVPSELRSEEPLEGLRGEVLVRHAHSSQQKS